MLERYRQLDRAPFEISRAIHDMRQLQLEPVDRRARRGMQTTASVYPAPDFGLFAFEYSEDVILTSREETMHIWLPVPVRRDATGRLRVREARSPIAVPGRWDPLPLAAHELRFGLSLALDMIVDFADRLMDLRTPPHFDVFETFDTRQPQHRAVGQLIVDLVEEDQADRGFLTDEARVMTYFEPIMALMLGGVFTDVHRRATPNSRDVKRAIDYIEAYLGQAITLSDLARVAGVPIRTLSAHFVASVGRPPMAYLTERRLDRARAMLRAGLVDSVTAAALAVGLTHFGRFAGNYRAQFGEMPSQTLARARSARGHREGAPPRETVR